MSGEEIKNIYLGRKGLRRKKQGAPFLRRLYFTVTGASISPACVSGPHKLRATYTAPMSPLNITRYCTAPSETTIH